MNIYCWDYVCPGSISAQLDGKATSETVLLYYFAIFSSVELEPRSCNQIEVET